jgi:hypothetical protein
MEEKFKQSAGDAAGTGRNNKEDEALLKAEDKIKSLVFKEQPAREGFRQELKSRILTGRQKFSMKFWQVKFMVPAVAFVFVLAFVTGAWYFNHPTGGKQLAFVPQQNSKMVDTASPTTIPAPTENTMSTGDLLNSVNQPESFTGSAIQLAVGIKKFSLGLVKPAFAEFPDLKAAEVKPSLDGAKVTLSVISNLSAFEKSGTKFSASQKQAIIDDNFLETSNPLIGDQTGGTDDFVDTYSALKGSADMYYREPQNAVFITSDLALHVYHVLVDRSFQALEETKLQPELLGMTRVLFEDSLANYNEATDPALKDSYKRLAAYYLIPLAILDTGTQADQTATLKPENFPSYAEYVDAQAAAQDKLGTEKFKAVLPDDKAYGGVTLPDDIYNLAKGELDLINDQSKTDGSPIFTPLLPDFVNDYTQFTPRSHYTKNNTLKSYFEAMMWYGRMGFEVKSPELTRDALLITGQVNTLKVGDKKISDQWGEMMAVIDFFVGQSDDLTPLQYTQEMKKVFGQEINASQLADSATIDKFTAGAIADLPTPKILSQIVDITGRNVTKEELLKETLQFRFMGQRFTPDAYVLNKLTQGAELPDPETGQKLPSMPTALMPLSVIRPDNQAVKGYLDSWVTSNAPKSDKIIAKTYNSLVAEFSSYASNIWTQNMYWNWLDALRIILGNYGAGYPFFMQTADWQKKDLGTALGSYTELKHDTLLYAKQSYAERGGGEPDEPKLPPVPKGYVEPDLAFWNKIVQLSTLTQKGLADRGMLPDGFDYKFSQFTQTATFCRDLASAELQNKKISDDDFEKLRQLSGSFSSVVEPLGGAILSTKDRRAGIIADIHTDASSSQILYEATGKPNLIFVAVKDINGARLTAGAAYDHYEFAAPLEGRLTDEDWQAKVYAGAGTLPAEDVWTSAIKK